MNRQLKFRAWNKKRNRMYEVLHLHMESFDGVWATVKGRSIIEDKDIHIQIQPKDIVVMQYTGLQDKNGKEIFESDIVRFYDAGLHFDPGDYQDIVVMKGAFGWLPFIAIVGSGKGPHNLFGNLKDYEVIGNIYESPHLLDKA